MSVEGTNLRVSYPFHACAGVRENWALTLDPRRLARDLTPSFEHRNNVSRHFRDSLEQMRLCQGINSVFLRKRRGTTLPVFLKRAERPLLWLELGS